MSDFRGLLVLLLLALAVCSHAEAQANVQNLFGGGRGDGTTGAESVVAPQRLAIDHMGALLVSDNDAAGRGQAVRRLVPGGLATTIIGNYIRGETGDGGLATQASISIPLGIAQDPADNTLYLAQGQGGIRAVNAAGRIRTVVRQNAQWYGVAIQGGKLYAVRADVNQVVRFSLPCDPECGPSTVIVNATGASGYSGDGGPAINARLFSPRDVVLAPDGTMFICDGANNAIRRVGTDGIITTIAGRGTSDQDGPALGVRLYNPIQLALAPNGDLYIADSGNNRVRRLRAGMLTTVLGSGARFDVLSPVYPCTGWHQATPNCTTDALRLPLTPMAVALSRDGSTLYAGTMQEQYVVSLPLAGGPVSTVTATIALNTPTSLPTLTATQTWTPFPPTATRTHTSTPLPTCNRTPVNVPCI